MHKIRDKITQILTDPDAKILVFFSLIETGQVLSDMIKTIPGAKPALIGQIGGGKNSILKVADEFQRAQNVCKFDL